MRKILFCLCLALLILSSTLSAQSESSIIDFESLDLLFPINDFAFANDGEGLLVGDEGKLLSLKIKQEQVLIVDNSLAYSKFIDYTFSDMKTVTPLGQDFYVMGNYYEYGLINRSISGNSMTSYTINLPKPDVTMKSQILVKDSSGISLADDSGILYMVGEKGYAAKLTLNQGQRDHTLVLNKGKKLTDLTMNAVKVMNKNKVFIACDQGRLFTTMDDGQNWQMKILDSQAALKSIALIDEKNLWISGENGLLFRSEDGGDHYTSMPFPIKTSLDNLYFLDRDNGFVIAKGFGVYYTYDGGYHWDSILESKKDDYSHIYITKDHRVWLLKNNSTLLYSDYFKNQESISGYKDVYGTNPGLLAIMNLTQKEIFKGFEGYFYPSTGYTRAEVVTVLSRISQLSGNTNLAFTDVKMSDWYYPYIQSMQGFGIIDGYGDGSFKPRETVSLEEICKIIRNLDKYLGKDTRVEDLDKAFASYQNKDRISTWARESFAYCLDKAYLADLDLENLEPGTKIKRREAAQIINRYLQ